MYCLAAKGGNNGESHNHNDIGSFILHSDGENFLTDLGAGEYTKEYFGPGRYEFFCNSSAGHSVPVIEGEYQKEGSEHHASLIGIETSDLRDKLIIDIAKAYKNKKLRSLIRHFLFDKSSDCLLELKDEFMFYNLPVSVTERLITLIEPKVMGDGIVRLEGQKNHLDIKYDSKAFICNVNHTNFINHNAVSIKVYTVDLEVKSTALEMETQILFCIMHD